jgi:hypothetical protein
LRSPSEMPILIGTDCCVNILVPLFLIFISESISKPDGGIRK